MPMSPTSDEASTASDPVASVTQAIESIAPVVTMWRDGLTVIPLASVVPNRAPEYLTTRRMAGDGSRPNPFAADQGAIWSEIGQRQRRAAHHSRTQALHEEVYQREADSVDEVVRAFPMPAGSRGVAIGLYDRIVGLDLFDSAETLERQWPRLIAGAASALLDHQRAIAAGIVPKPRHRNVDHGALGRLTDRALNALTNAIASSSVGLGHDVRFDGPKVVGTALVHDGRTIHLALFRPRLGLADPA